MNQVIVVDLLAFISAALVAGLGYSAAGGLVARYRALYIEETSHELRELFSVASAADLFTIGCAIGFGGAIVGWLIGGLVVGVAFGAVGFIAPRFWIRRMKAKRVALFEEQLVDALGMMSSALRAGLSLSQAIDRIVKTMPSPISNEFGVLRKERLLGVSEDDGLESLARRVESEDLKLVVAAVITCRRVGGNLAEVFETMATTIRDRFRMEGKVKALTSQVVAEAWIVGFIPFVILGLLYVVDPAYVSPLFEDPIGMCVLGAVVLLEALGAFVMTQMARIEV